MTAGLDQLDHLEAINLDIVLGDWVHDHEKELSDLNREQLDKGLDADGVDLGEYSSIKYKGRKRPIDLLLTGDFRDSIVTDPETGGFISNATDIKYSALQKKYTPNIVGTPTDKYEVVADGMAEAVIDKIHNVA